MRASVVWRLLCLGLLAFAPRVSAQSLVIEPYLQHVTPTSVELHWESRGGGSGSLEWGTTRQLGQRATAESLRTSGTNRLHVVTLRGLSPDTRYYYRVRVAGAATQVFDLRTLPSSYAEADLRMVVMSDMQRDGARPRVFETLVQRGLLPLVSESARARGRAPAMALLAGDLVRHGQRYDVWNEELFRPLREFSRHVPLYAVAGNHDEDSPHYFRYFTLPNNGSPQHSERWWWQDFSNVRVIGLDSNERYRNREQLAWLEHTLNDACAAAHVDFVFATMHHPEKSELWPSGEEPYSGRIAREIERFSETCKKPSTIFTGHTHAYARGHDRDRPVTYVSVASAGGNLDQVGEYRARDYPEYVTSQDDYGYVLVDVHAGSAPWFRLQRISMGDTRHQRDNELRDEVIVRRHDAPPVAPEPMWPRNELVHPRNLTLTISRFSDNDGDRYGATRWQVSDGSCDFSSPLVDTWHQADRDAAGRPYDTREHGENYLHLTEVTWGASYCYRARVRDSSLSWSEWSKPQRFRTLPAPLTQIAESAPKRSF